MSTARGAKLKAQYNRVRTSTALRANDMWTNTIGMEQDPQAGSNAAIEAAIYAPTHGGGAAARAQRRELAQQLIQKTGYQPSVTDYQGLLTLAKEQGSLGAGTRGACKLCGGMGHLTKQCTNFLTGHNAVGTDIAAVGGGEQGGMGLLPDPDALGLSDLSSSSSSEDDRSGSSGSDSDSGREKRRSKKRKRSSSSKKEKKSKKIKREHGEKKHSKKSKKSKSHKGEKKRSRQADESGSD